MINAVELRVEPLTQAEAGSVDLARGWAQRVRDKAAAFGDDDAVYASALAGGAAWMLGVLSPAGALSSVGALLRPLPGFDLSPSFRVPADVTRQIVSLLLQPRDAGAPTLAWLSAVALAAGVNVQTLQAAHTGQQLPRLERRTFTTLPGSSTFDADLLKVILPLVNLLEAHGATAAHLRQYSQHRFGALCLATMALPASTALLRTTRFPCYPTVRRRPLF